MYFNIIGVKQCFEPEHSYYFLQVHFSLLEYIIIQSTDHSPYLDLLILSAFYHMWKMPGQLAGKYKQSQTIDINPAKFTVA